MGMRMDGDEGRDDYMNGNEDGDGGDGGEKE